MLDLAAEAEDEATFKEAETELAGAEVLYDKIETQSLLNEPGDDGNVFLSVQAGTGGTDACDWAATLLSCACAGYKQGLDIEIIDAGEDEVAGIRESCGLDRGTPLPRACCAAKWACTGWCGSAPSTPPASARQPLPA